MSYPMEQRALLTLQSDVFAWRMCSQGDHNLESDSNDDEWWRESSCSSCSVSDEDGCLEEVGPKGELFYIECMTENISSSVYKWKNHETKETQPKRSRSWRKGAQGTLMRLVQRSDHLGLQKKGSQRSRGKEDGGAKSLQVPSLIENLNRSHLSNKTPFYDNQSVEFREVHMLLEPRKHNLGRRASLCEALMGLIPGYFLHESSDDKRIMVAGFIPDTEAARHRSIKIGDWLYGIDGQEVTHQNIDSILGTIISPCMVTVTFRKIVGYNVAQSAPFLLSKGLEVDQLLHVLCRGTAATIGGSVVLLSINIRQDQFDDRESHDKEEVLYCYPENPHPSLVSTRGVFLTLFHVLSELCHSKLQMTSLVLNGEQICGVYYRDEGNLVLFAFPKFSSSLLIAKEISFHFMKAVQFSYQSFTRAAFEHKSRLDLLVDCMFKEYFKFVSGQTHHIRHIIPMAQVIPLARETQNDLNSALAELASADFDYKSTSHHRPQYLMVLGYCLLFKGVTVCSQLPMGMLSDVQSLCWLHGLDALDVEGAPLRRLIAWKQVYVSNYCIVPDATLFTVNAIKHFILLLGQNHFTLSVLFETRQHAQRREEYSGPPIEYVQQAQNVLDTILHLGTADVIETCLERHSRPLVGESVVPTSNKRFSSRIARGSTAEQLMRNLRLNTTEQHLTTSKTLSIEESISLSSLSHKTQKILSVNKQQKMSGRSSENSEDTCSQSASDGVLRAMSDTSSEESWCENSDNQFDTDVEHYDTRASLQSLSIPTKFVEGPENCFLQYITFETNVGIILSSDIGTKSSNSALLSNFHASCITLQFMLQESKQNLHRPWMNQSVAATTELGVMFECPQENGATEIPTTYWVVGRHLSGPHPREIYVCYEDTISLSLVELAFRLAFVT